MATKVSQPPEVAVIGAGVSGLVAARRLAAEGFRVTIYERRKLPGGVWNYTKDSDTTSIDSLLMTAWNRWSEGPNRRPTFASAVYKDLQTNFPRQLMELQDHAWAHQPLFMSHSLVYSYLLDYAKQMPRNVQIRGDKEVVDLYYAEATGGWKLTFRDVSTNTTVTKDYRAVVVAVGVFDKPFIPELGGLREWSQRWSGSLSHSKNYRNPDNFRRKKVVIVGYGASGFDIASKVSTHAAKLWISTSDDSARLPPGAQRMPRLVHLDPSQKRLYFEDGEQVAGVDRVIFCTGYSYSQPFIRAERMGSYEPLFPDGPVIPDLHEHVIYIHRPTLAFIGLVKGAVPTFLIVQAQAAFLSRVWAGRDPRLSISLTDGVLLLGVPSEDAHKELVCHELPHPKFMDYLLGLELTCLEADGPSTFGQNMPCQWTLEHEWVLQNRREIRTKFFSFSPQERQGISSLQQLFSAPGEWQLLQTVRFDGILPFAILHAGYFSRRAQQRPAELPRKSLQFEDPPDVFLYINPGFLVAMATRSFWVDHWQKLRTVKSRSTFMAGARRLVRLCRDDIEEAIQRIEKRMEWSRPGRHLQVGASLSSFEDDFSRLETMRNGLAPWITKLNSLDDNLAKIVRFDVPIF